MWYVTYRGVLALFLLMEWIFPQEYASLSGIHGQQYGGPFLFRRAACRCADTGHL